MLAAKQLVFFLRFRFADVLASGIFQPPVLKPVQYGDDVTLECIINRRVFGNAHQVFWIHRTIGGSYQTIRSTHENQRKCAGESQDSFNLSITHLDASALGTYYCGVVTNQLIFCKKKVYFLCTGNETIRGIFQPPVLRPVQYGDDVTLECIINRGVFGDAHQVFWIHRTIRGSYQTIRSTHENKRTCESQECVYSLQKKNFSFQDMGTYYCALVTCGEVILGNGTEFTGKLTHNYRYHNHHVGKMLANSILYTLNLLIKQTPGSCIVFVFGKFRKYMLLII
uniref:Ig-like domain-containing protein n=1 Tax=Erpetoichthys calabaricus TaxID=27687 RepID=A0A8C4XBS4_ERPCA